MNPTGCEPVRKDELTVYQNGVGYRQQQLNVLTKPSQATIDLPMTVAHSTVLPMFNDLRIVPHDLKGSQLLLDMPSGIVRVEDKEGEWHEGSLDHVTGTEVVIRDLDTDALIHIANYNSLHFLDRSLSRQVNLSYLLGGLSWIAKHTLLINSEEEQVISFKTMAVVTNRTGVTFNLTSLKLGIGGPDTLSLPSSSSSSSIVQRASREQQRQRMSVRPMAEMEAKFTSAPAGVALAAAPSPSAVAAAAPSYSIAEEEADFGAEMVRESNLVQNDGIEDFEFVDIGPQSLRETGRFDILNLTDIPIHKLYKHTLTNNNRDVQLFYRMITPEEVHIPAGQIVLYNYDPEESKIGSYLGESHIEEHYQKDRVDILLGDTKVVRASCTVQHTKEDKYPDDERHDHGDLGSSSSALVDPRAITRRRLAESKRSQYLSSLLGYQGYGGYGGYGGYPSIIPGFPGFPVVPRVEDIDIVIKDVPKVDVYKIICTYTNNSSRNEAKIIASFPVPSGVKILSVDPPYSDLKHGQMTWNILVEPSKVTKFECTIVTE